MNSTSPTSCSLEATPSTQIDSLLKDDRVWAVLMPLNSKIYHDHPIIVFDTNPYFIGREPDCDTRLNHRFISRHHCKLVCNRSDQTHIASSPNEQWDAIVENPHDIYIIDLSRFVSP